MSFYSIYVLLTLFLFSILLPFLLPLLFSAFLSQRLIFFGCSAFFGASYVASVTGNHHQFGNKLGTAEKYGPCMR
jgi:hypothetical protein